MPFLKFPSIRQYKDAIRDVKFRASYRGDDERGEPIYDSSATIPVLRYQGTVKTHGTNSAVSIQGDTLIAQSRNRQLSLDDDNFGFAKFVLEEVGRDFWLAQATSLRQQFSLEPQEIITIYGELVGQGIHKDNVAVGKLERRFIVFAIRVGIDDPERWLDISSLKFEHPRISNVYQFEHYELDIDFANPALSTNRLVEITEQVEKCCPVGKAFEIDGTGEGVVWKCITEGYTDSRFWFKVKGVEHSVSKVKTLASVDIEKVNTIDEFVERVLTEQRLQQGIAYLKEMNQEISTTGTGLFLKWLVGDVLKEEGDALEASMLTEKEVNKVLATKAREWYFREIQRM